MEEKEEESTRMSLEIYRNERKYEFFLDKMSPLGECYDVMCEFRSYVKNMMDKLEENEKNKEKQD